LREKDTRSLLPARPFRCFAQKTPGVFFPQQGWATAARRKRLVRW